MDVVGSFEIDRLHYGVIQLGENHFQISVPSVATQRTAFHVAPCVYATIYGDHIEVTGDVIFDAETEQAIKAAIKMFAGQENEK